MVRPASSPGSVPATSKVKSTDERNREDGTSPATTRERSRCFNLRGNLLQEARAPGRRHLLSPSRLHHSRIVSATMTGRPLARSFTVRSRGSRVRDRPVKAVDFFLDPVVASLDGRQIVAVAPGLPKNVSHHQLLALDLAFEHGRYAPRTLLSLRMLAWNRRSLGSCYHKLWVRHPATTLFFPLASRRASTGARNFPV